MWQNVAWADMGWYGLAWAGMGGHGRAWAGMGQYTKMPMPNNDPENS